MRKMAATIRTKLALAASVFIIAIASAPVLTGSEANNPLSDLVGTSEENTVPDLFAGGNPLAGARLYVDPDSSAAQQAIAWQSDRPEDAAAMARLAEQPAAHWVTSATSIDDSLDGYLDAATARSETAVVVAYNIPNRDCGLYSSGGAQSIGEYEQFIDALAARTEGKRAVVILEPDAVANLAAGAGGNDDCLGETQRAEYFHGLTYAVDRLKQSGAIVYIDAGNSGWVKDTVRLASTLRQAGVDRADGFSLNVSNFRSIDQSASYGDQLSEDLDGRHYVIDTSRNGLGNFDNPRYEGFGWCNPPGRALGHYPTVDTGRDRVDAYLYIKTPGESDGRDSNPDKCFNGPKAGEWWPEYALGLVRRWPQELQP